MPRGRDEIRLAWALAILAANGCGRVAFDALADGQGVGDGDGSVSDSAAMPGLVLHFPFEPTDLLADHGTGQRTGTCTTCPTSGPGRIGAGAAVFDGTQCVAIPFGPDLAVPAFTMMMWYEALPSGNTMLLSHPRDGATMTGNTFNIHVRTGPDTVNTLIMDIYVGAPSTRNEWHHVAGVFDGATITIYVDGVPGPGTVVPAAVHANDAILIGCEIDAGAELFHWVGSIDDVRIYDRVVPASEIAAIAATP